MCNKLMQNNYSCSYMYMYMYIPCMYMYMYTLIAFIVKLDISYADSVTRCVPHLPVFQAQLLSPDSAVSVPTAQTPPRGT